MELIITKHAKDRAKERLGINKKALIRKVKVAAELGEVTDKDGVRFILYQDIKYVIDVTANILMTVVFLNEGVSEYTESLMIRGEVVRRKVSNKRSLIQTQRKLKEKMYGQENAKN